jgi:hypothetical protein
MPQPPNTIAYRSYYYEVAMVGRADSAWAVYNADGQAVEGGTIIGGSLEAARQSARDWIDNIMATDLDGNQIPDEEELVQDESPSFDGDYTNSICKSQPKVWTQPFIIISSDGYFLQENKVGDTLRLDNNDLMSMTLPTGYKMQVNVVFKSQEEYGLGERQRTIDRATLYLEGGDSLSVTILNDEVTASLIQNGQERINPDNLVDYNTEGKRKTVTLVMKMFEICTPKEGDDFVQDDEVSIGLPFDNDMLLFVLGGLVLLIIAGYVINTTSEVMGDG